MAIMVLDRYVTNLIPLTSVVNLDGAGAGSKTLITVPPGETWELERLTYDGAGAAAVVSLYAGIPTVASLKEAFSGNRGVADESSPIRFFATEELILVVTGGTAAATVGVNGQLTSVLYMPRELPVDADNLAMSTHGPGTAAYERGDAGTPADEGWN
jgi:hypothetical protein